MKIAVFEVEEWEREAFSELQVDHEVTMSREALNADNASEYADCEVVSTFIYSDMDKKVLQQFDSLKMISTRSTGYDHIDMEYCAENGIVVSNVPSYGDNTVAEHTFGLLLTLSHHLEEAVDRTRKGDFSPQGLQGFDLEGKTLGVIGTGNIGLHVIRIARGFNMEVLAYDPYPREEEAERLGFKYTDMDELLAHSDVITMHVPGGKKTRHLLNHEQFEKMKKGVYILNTSRGELIETRALVRAIADGTVAGAGLDVLPQEPVIREEAELLRRVYQEEHDLNTLFADHILMRMRNVVVTPHSAFNTKEAVMRILTTTADNITAFVNGESLNVVNDQG